MFFDECTPVQSSLSGTKYFVKINLIEYISTIRLGRNNRGMDL